MTALRLVFDRWGEPSPRKIDIVVDILHKGGVAAFPTDSVYALGCAIDSRDGIERIVRAKNLSKHHRLAMICPDLSTASEFGVFSQTAFRLAQRLFPGPFTLVVPATRSVPRTLTDHKRRTVGIRIPDHPIAQAVSRKLGRPLLTSSAMNPAEETPCHDADEILEVFGRHLDVVIDTAQPHGQPSTVLEVDGENVTLVRQGQGSLEGIIDVASLPEPEPSAIDRSDRRARRSS